MARSFIGIRMASPFHILGSAAALRRRHRSPAAHPRPDWLKVRFFGGTKLPGTEAHHALAGSAHGVRKRALPEPGRMLGTSHRDVHDPRQHLHARVRLLRGAFRDVRWAPDEDEPERVAEAVEQMNLRYAVVTSVNRDDQPDGGSAIFARTIAAIRERVPECRVEVLIPDFRGDWSALETVLAAQARRAQPQHRNRAAALSPSAARRALRALAGTAAARQAACARRCRSRPA